MIRYLMDTEFASFIFTSSNPMSSSDSLISSSTGSRGQLVRGKQLMQLQMFFLNFKNIVLEPTGLCSF